MLMLLRQVGPAVVFSWFRHYLMLGVYSLLAFVSRPLHRFFKGYRAQRIFEAWKWGSGLDYEYGAHR